ncbi:MAG: BMP family ABC transporter substrate-binding protein [Clostridia bacterium]|nr:BMP family ABC transporter substrate-binding protein [Clostridia bacterium]
MNLIVREEYLAALKEGQREYKELTAAGKTPYPAVLDELLPNLGGMTVQELPCQEIPVDRIVGTRTAGRISALSAGFLPLLSEETEFAMKWMALCEAHLSDTGIRDAIACYEYLGSFYVQEGNKRVSVLKHFGNTRILSEIRRVMPEKSDEPRIRAYYEFVDFHRATGSYDIQFSKPGEYAKLLAALEKKPGDIWPEEERRRFASRYHYFREAFMALGGQKKDLRPEDALLLWLRVYPYEQLGSMTKKELKDSLLGLWQDVQVTAAEAETIALRTAPPEAEEKSLLTKLVSPAPKRLNVGMIYQQDEEISTWTRGHAEGAAHLAEALGEQVTVREYRHADTPELAESLLDQAVEEGAELVFTTTPPLLGPTLKAAVKWPKVRFLNCSAGTNLSSVRSYYCRIYEGKFITGLIAGAMAKNDLIGYVASYPILGVPASINAFSLGARMTNPRARILLEWSCMEGNAVQKLIDRGARVISNRDVPVPNAHYMGLGEYGTYLIDAAGRLSPLASPCWMWGKLYENLVRAVLSGSYDQKKAPEAINYWWGMDSGVIDVQMTELVPEGIRTLAASLMDQIKAGTLLPFRRELIDQDGTVKNDGSRDLTSLELLTMDYLSDAVEGAIPAYGELLPMSRGLVRELGLHREDLPVEK